MKIKKFTGKTFQDAFEHVKEELGANAVILNSRKIKHSGVLDFVNTKEVYEITAAVDQMSRSGRPTPAVQKVTKTYHKAASRPQVSRNSGGEKSTAIQSPRPTLILNQKLREQTQEIKLLHNEMKDIKKVLNQVSDFLKYSRMPALPEMFKSMLKKLVDNEVHEDLAKAIIQTVYSQTKPGDYKNKEAITKNLASLLFRMIREVEPLEKVDRSPYVVTLVGPTGVGKTTTVAKLAANLKLHHHKKVAIISADTYRIAAIEQLQTFANIANIPMDVVYSPEDMREAIYRFKDRDAILIDTVGRSQRHEQHLRDLNKFIETANPDEVHLVLSLTTGLKNLLDIVRRFSIMRPNRFLFTKLDETIHSGNIINVLYKHQMPVSYLTVGQVVPNDITTANREHLANLIFEGVSNQA